MPVSPLSDRVHSKGFRHQTTGRTGAAPRPRVLHLSCLETEAPDAAGALLPRDTGWLAAAMDPAVREAVDLVGIHAAASGRLPDPEPFSGVIIGGSSCMLTDTGEPWVGRLRSYLFAAADAGLPMLGICFGHQILAQVFGGAVVRKPSREFGKCVVRLTAAGRKDPLFAGFDPVFDTLMSHSEVVDGLPARAVALAANPYHGNQAIAIGERIRGVQFHPEFTVPVMRSLLAKRKQVMAAEGLPVAAIRAGLGETPAARRVVDNFMDHFILGRAPETG